jgi:hypothetical protein
MNMARSTGSGVIESRKWLARIVALATLTLAVGVAPSQAGTIGPLLFSDSQPYNDFEFSYGTYGYKVRISFEDIISDFSLSVTDTQVASPTVPLPATSYWAGWKCTDMAPTAPNQCVQFDVTPPPSGSYTGDIDILVQFGLYGWPAYGPDPIVIGDIDSFSSRFMVFGNNDNADPLDPLYPLEFRLGYLPSSATDPDDWNDITLKDCPGDDFDICLASVPEPASIGGVVWGLLGLTLLSRRLRRRD